MKERRYIYMSRMARLAAGAFDRLGRLALGRGLTARPAPFDLTREPQRVLVLVLDHLGDAVFSTPAVKAIAELWPHAYLTVLCGEWSADLFRPAKWVDEVMIFNAPWFAERAKRRSFEAIAGEAAVISELGFDIAIDLRGDLRHILMLHRAQVPVRAGFAVTGGGFLLSMCPAYPWDAHAVDKRLAIAQAMGAHPADRLPVIPQDPEAETRIAGLFERRRLAKSHPLVGIHPGAGTEAKRWPYDQFAMVADTLFRDHAATLVITGSESEAELAKRVHARMVAPAEVLAGETTVGELVAVLRRLVLFISGDTGPLHIAAALGVPTIALWSGTNDPALWGPLGGESTIISSDVECAPCGQTECVNPRCMTGISVDQVLQAAVAKLDSLRR